MKKYKKIIWASPQFNDFRKWLFENYDISLIPNKNSFQVQSPGEHRLTMPVVLSKIFFYARVYYTEASNTIPNNDVKDQEYLTWWYAGQELWPEIRRFLIHDDITDLVYFTDWGNQ